MKPGTYTYRTEGTCSRTITFTIDASGIVTSVEFEGGCPGNTFGLSQLCRGQKASDLIERLGGIDCRARGTSCPDQLAKALAQVVNG